MSDLEQVATLHDAAAKAFTHAIEAAAHYAVEMDPHDVAALRAHLAALTKNLADVNKPDVYEETQSSFRGELRDYRDRTQREISRLRTELSGCAAAMRHFAATVSDSADQHEKEIEEEVHHLEEAAETEDLRQIRTAISHAASSIEKSCVQMKVANQAVITQLQDEIRTLHQEIDRERRAMFTDRGSGVWNRQKIDTRLEDLLRADDPFCVLLIGIQDYPALNQLFSRSVIESALRALLNRLDNTLGGASMIARWSENMFAAVVEVARPDAMDLLYQMERKLNGTYAIQENGIARSVQIKTAIGIVEHARGAGPEVFYTGLGQIGEAIFSR